MSTHKSDDVLVAAYLWWREKRPEGWDESRHLVAPAINCWSENEVELARKVADYVNRRPKITLPPPPIPVNRRS